MGTSYASIALLLDQMMHLWMPACWCPVMQALNKVQDNVNPRLSLRCMHIGRSCCMTRMQVLLDKARANSKTADPAKHTPNGSADDGGTRTAGTHAPVLTQKSKTWLEWLDGKLFTDRADAWLKEAHTQGMQEYNDEVTFCHDVCCLGGMPTKQSPSSLREFGKGGEGGQSCKCKPAVMLLADIAALCPPGLHAESCALCNRSYKALKRCGASDSQLHPSAGTS